MSTEANAKVYDVNQRTMQALNKLAIMHAAFEQAVANLEVEISEEDLLFVYTEHLTGRTFFSVLSVFVVMIFFTCTYVRVAQANKG